MHIVILAGGTGTRFWPLSRPERPKQLLTVWGERPMLAQTVDRVRPLVADDALRVVISEGMSDAIREQIPEMEEDELLEEPLPRNTLGAIVHAVSSLLARGVSEDTVIAVVPADHWVRNASDFRDVVSNAGTVASRTGAIVMLGVEPTRPETGYGYIGRNELDEDGSAAVRAFVEKPDHARALELLNDETYLWNTGCFVFTIATFLAELDRQQPKAGRVLNELKAAHAAADIDKVRELFEELPDLSMDYGVMEGATTARVIPVRFGWSDVGHWAALHDVRERDEDGNVRMGDVVAIDCRNSVLVGHDRRVLAAVGLTDMVVVDSVDAVLVVPRTRVQEVRHIVDRLKGRGTSTES